MLQYLSKTGDSHERHFEYFFANRSVTVIRWLVSGYDHAVHFTSSHQYLMNSASICENTMIPAISAVCRISVRLITFCAAILSCVITQMNCGHPIGSGLSGTRLWATLTGIWEIGGISQIYRRKTSGYEPFLTRAVIKTVPVILDQMLDIYRFIDGQVFLSDTRKTFYKTILETRAEVILKPAYECCISGKYKMDSRERLEGGADYTEQDFERDG